MLSYSKQISQVRAFGCLVEELSSRLEASANPADAKTKLADTAVATNKLSDTASAETKQAEADAIGAALGGLAARCVGPIALRPTFAEICARLGESSLP